MSQMRNEAVSSEAKHLPTKTRYTEKSQQACSDVSSSRRLLHEHRQIQPLNGTQENNATANNTTPDIPSRDSLLTTGVNNERDCRESITIDLRKHMFIKVVKTIYPTVYPDLMHDERLKKIAPYAKIAECEAYKQATSRGEYYNLIAKKIYEIQKDIEKRRIERKAEASKVLSNENSENKQMDGLSTESVNVGKDHSEGENELVLYALRECLLFPESVPFEYSPPMDLKNPIYYKKENVLSTGAVDTVRDWGEPIATESRRPMIQKLFKAITISNDPDELHLRHDAFRYAEECENETYNLTKSFHEYYMSIDRRCSAWLNQNEDLFNKNNERNLKTSEVLSDEKSVGAGKNIGDDGTIDTNDNERKVSSMSGARYSTEGESRLVEPENLVLQNHPQTALIPESLRFPCSSEPMAVDNSSYQTDLSTKRSEPDRRSPTRMSQIQNEALSSEAEHLPVKKRYKKIEKFQEACSDASSSQNMLHEHRQIQPNSNALNGTQENNATANNTIFDISSRDSLLYTFLLDNVRDWREPITTSPMIENLLDVLYILTDQDKLYNAIRCAEKSENETYELTKAFHHYMSINGSGSAWVNQSDDLFIKNVTRNIKASNKLLDRCFSTKRNEPNRESPQVRNEAISSEAEHLPAKKRYIEIEKSQQVSSDVSSPQNMLHEHRQIKTNYNALIGTQEQNPTANNTPVDLSSRDSLLSTGEVNSVRDWRESIRRVDRSIIRILVEKLYPAAILDFEHDKRFHDIVHYVEEAENECYELAKSYWDYTRLIYCKLSEICERLNLKKHQNAEVGGPSSQQFDSAKQDIEASKVLSDENDESVAAGKIIENDDDNEKKLWKGKKGPIVQTFAFKYYMYLNTFRDGKRSVYRIRRRFAPVRQETFFKDDANHDPQWSDEQLISARLQHNGVLIGQDEIDIMRKMSAVVFEVLEKVWATVNCAFIDMKVEFGIDEEGNIVLADIIDSDSWRLWPSGDKRLRVDKDVYRQLASVSAGDLDTIKKNFAWASEQLERIIPKNDHLVVILMGSASDTGHCEKIAKACQTLGLNTELRVTSAHKGPEDTLRIMREYESVLEKLIFITVAGRSNGLGPVLSGNTTYPVINCPPVNADNVQLDVWSSLNLPSGLGCCTVLYPEAAALHAAQILGLSNFIIWGKLRARQIDNLLALKKADKSLRGVRASKP